MTIDTVQGTLKAVEKKTELSVIFKPIGRVWFRLLNKKVVGH
jgi:hypothetical protein